MAIASSIRCRRTMQLFCAIALLWGGAVQGCESSGGLAIKTGPPFESTTGEIVDPFRLEGAVGGLVLVFITNDCPICNAYAPELERLRAAYESRGIAWLLVQVDPDVTLEQARAHAAAYSMKAATVLDPRHDIVTAVGATTTPEAAVVDRDGRLVYRGRIDDRFPEVGARRLEPTRRDLRDALESLLGGRRIAEPRTRAVGCIMPDPRE